MKHLQILKTMLSKSVKLAIATGLVASVVGCTAGNPYVEFADRNEVITLGDSIFDLNSEIQANLESFAGQTFRDYTLSAAEIKGGILAVSVTEQYEDAKDTDANIDTVVMNGGGNDILIPAKAGDLYGCRTRWYRKNISSRCKNLVEDVYVDVVDLLNRMESENVENVIYLGYFHPKGSDANLSQAVDYGNQWVEYACETTSAANCTFTPSVDTMTPADIEDDDIHPTVGGSLKLANLIWPHLEPLL